MYINFMIEENKNHYIYYWLLLITFLVALMIIVGGLTRLTDSGLSITRWDLFAGIIPPLTTSDWEIYFSLYKKIPQYNIKLPHMGWNDVSPLEKDTLFKCLDSPHFYFLHSYYFATENLTQVLATTNYNGPFTSAVRRGLIFGVQFHPEKSHHWGIQLLENFAEL